MWSCITTSLPRPAEIMASSLWPTMGATYTQNDYDVWRSNFGRPIRVGAVADASEAVPEPATLVLLILASASFCPWRKR